MRKILFAICLLLTISSLSLAQEYDPTLYEIALERIAEAERTNATELDLSLLNLTELPPEIGNLSNLQELDVSSNHLSSLPSEIGNLTNLQTLFLESNDLSSCPLKLAISRTCKHFICLIMT